MAADGKERRRVPRVTRRVAVQFESRGRRLPGVLINFSEIGLLVQCNEVLAAGSQILVPMAISSGQVHQLLGIVAWSQPPIQKGILAGRPGCMGVTLSAAPPEYLSAVAKMRKHFASEAPRGFEERFEVYHRVCFESGAHFLKEYTENLSRGGMYLATDRELNPGEKVEAVLEIPGLAEPVRLEGKVAYRLDADAAEARGRTTGVGIQFVNLTADAKGKLHQYIQRLEIHRTSPERRKTGKVPRSGSLMEVLPPELMIGASIQRWSGMIRVEHEQVSKRIYLKEGKPVHVESSLPSETFGSFLIYSGILPLETLTDWLPRLDLSSTELGVKLLEKGVLSEQDLADTLVRWQEEKLIQIFSWFDGTYKFLPEADWPSDLPAAPIQLYRVVFDGVQRWYDASLVASWMGLTGETFIRRISMPDPKAIIPPTALRLLTELWTPMSISALERELEIPTSELLPVTFALVLAGWITLDFSNAPSKGDAAVPLEKRAAVPASSALKATVSERLAADYRRFSELSFFEILGVRSGASESEVDGAFAQKSQPYEVILSSGELSTEDSTRVNQLLAWLEVSRLMVLQSGTYSVPVQSDAAEASAQPSRWMAQALQCLEGSDVEGALQILGHVPGPLKEHSSILGYQAWAKYLKDQGHAAAAGHALDSAIEADPSDPWLCYFRGQIYFRSQAWKFAKLYFLRCRRLLPSFSKMDQDLAVASQKLEELERSQESASQ